MVMKDKWMNLCYEEDELKPYIEPEPELNDQRRVDALIHVGHQREEIEESLRARKYDDIMANYLLLAQRAKDNDQSDSRSSSSLSLRGLRPALEVGNNGQSPAHTKVQRSVSASTKPRRFSHGGDNNSTNANAIIAPATTYKRQNTLDVNSVKERERIGDSGIGSSMNGPQSPVSVSKMSTSQAAKNMAAVLESPPITPSVLNSSKLTAGSLRAKAAPVTLKNFSGIPRRNTYNYTADKNAPTDKTTLPDLPSRSVELVVSSLAYNSLVDI